MQVSAQTSPQDSNTLYKAHVPGEGDQVLAAGLWGTPWQEEDKAFPCQPPLTDPLETLSLCQKG